MTRIVVGSPNLTQPLLIYLGLGPAMLEQHRRSYCAGILIFSFFFFIVFYQSFFFRPFSFFLLSVLLSFLLLSNCFFLLSFVFPLLFRHCFIPVSLAHVVSSLAYPNLLGTKRLGCCCFLFSYYSDMGNFLLWCLHSI
jgi:hypothetical protein